MPFLCSKLQLYTRFLYKNILNKNIKVEICDFLKNISINQRLEF